MPVIGARTRAQLDEALGALADNAEHRMIARATDAVLARHEVAGTRYDTHRMKMLDSEKPERRTGGDAHRRSCCDLGVRMDVVDTSHNRCGFGRRCLLLNLTAFGA